MQTTRYSMPLNDEATNRLMSELALQSAIEIERFTQDKSSSLPSLRELAAVLDENNIDDLTLIPVYDRALASEGNAVRSKQEMHSKLSELSKRMENVHSEQDISLDTLKDFCLSLHEALLNARVQTLYQSSSGR